MRLERIGLRFGLSLGCHFAWLAPLPLFGGHQPVFALNRLVQRKNFLLFLADKRVEHRHFLEIVPLLVLAKAPEIRLILGACPVKIEFVLFPDQPADFLGLLNVRAGIDIRPLTPFACLRREDFLAIRSQGEAPLRQAEDLNPPDGRLLGEQRPFFLPAEIGWQSIELPVHGHPAVSFRDVAQLDSVAAAPFSSVLHDPKPEIRR